MFDKTALVVYNMSMKKIWMHRANSFKEAADFESDYYMNMTGAERLNTMQFLRETYLKLKARGHGNGKGLRRVIKII